MKVLAQVCITLSLALFSVSFTQGEYEEIERVEVDAIASSFALNREKLPFAVYRIDGVMYTSWEQERWSSSLAYEILLFEDIQSKRCRADIRFWHTTESGLHATPWTSHLIQRNRLRRVTNHRTQNGDLPQHNQSNRFPWHSIDPWMLPIAHPEMLNSGFGFSPFSFQQSFPEQGFLWAESNGKFVRAEWDVGIRENVPSRLQVYFNLDKDKMPTMIRRIVPQDSEVRFAKRGIKYETEFYIHWIKQGDGYVPHSVQVKREDFDFSGRTVRKETASFEFTWQTDLVEFGMPMETKIFDPAEEGMDSDSLTNSFRK